MIGIIILNYNNYEVTLKCVESIFNSKPKEEYHILVIDNGSTNDSLEKLEAKYCDEERVTVHGLEKNIGFAAGNDVGITFYEDQNIQECILTNSDVLFKENSIDRLMETLRNREDAVIVGPKIWNFGGGGTALLGI